MGKIEESGGWAKKKLLTFKALRLPFKFLKR